MSREIIASRFFCCLQGRGQGRGRGRGQGQGCKCFLLGADLVSENPYYTRSNSMCGLNEGVLYDFVAFSLI